MPGDIAVQQVGQAGHDVNAQRHIAAAGKAPIVHHEKHRAQKDPQQRQLIGRIHFHALIPPLSFRR